VEVDGLEYMVDLFVCYKVVKKVLIPSRNGLWKDVEPGKYVVVNTFGRLNPGTVYPHQVRFVEDEEIPLFVHGDVHKIVEALKPTDFLLVFREAWSRLPRVNYMVFPNVESVITYFESKCKNALVVRLRDERLEFLVGDILGGAVEVFLKCCYICGEYLGDVYHKFRDKRGHVYKVCTRCYALFRYSIEGNPNFQEV